MATEKQKAAAKRNIKRAQSAPRKPGGSAAARNDLTASQFAFPEQRKEPLTDAAHVRNAIARFDQVEGVSDKDRAAAWRRIKAAAKKHDVQVSEKSWQELMKGGTTAR